MPLKLIRLLNSSEKQSGKSSDVSVIINWFWWVKASAYERHFENSTTYRTANSELRKQTEKCSAWLNRAEDC